MRGIEDLNHLPTEYFPRHMNSTVEFSPYTSEVWFYVVILILIIAVVVYFIVKR